MSAADNLPRTQFGSVVFPSEVTRLRMQFRHHVHEYPHAPGGSPEKLGRGLVNVTVRASFQDRFPAYPNLYPAGMQQMFVYAQNGSTQNLVHPSSGTFPAFIINWDQEKEAKLRSGEKVDIEFLEDQESSFALAAIATPDSSASLSPTSDQLAEDWLSASVQLGVTTSDQSVFDALQNAVATVEGFSDTTQLYGNRYAAALTNVINLCSQVEKLQSMQDVRAWPVLDTLFQLWEQAVSASKDLQSQRVQLQIYVVPRTMSVIEIAMFLYKGDASRQVDILTLNSDVITNPLRVRAATQIRYYTTPPAQIQAA